MNKPVAWMETYKGEPNNLDWDKSNLNYGSEFHDVIPLYTHPSEHDLGIAEAIGFEKGHKSAEDMLRQQQAEIKALKAKLNKYHLKEDLDRNLNLIYGKEFIK